MQPTPIYSAERLHEPAYHLRYTWSGWPSAGDFPPEPDPEFFSELEKLWESDGIRLLDLSWSPQVIQCACSVKPNVDPILFCSRIKGRLQHGLRSIRRSTKFSRKVGFRTIGENRRADVEAYIANQVSKASFIDERFASFLQRYTVCDPSISLTEPLATNSGRFWYNLHLVLVTEARMRFTDEASLEKLSRLFAAISFKKGYRVSTRAVMPDHVHLALGGNISESPEEIALGFMNNTAFAFGQQAIWRPGYYAGSFGEYDMDAVRF